MGELLGLELLVGANLTSRLQNKRERSAGSRRDLAALLPLENRVDDGQQVRGGHAASSLCAALHILAGLYRRDHVLLDWARFVALKYPPCVNDSAPVRMLKSLPALWRCSPGRADGSWPLPMC